MEPAPEAILLGKVASGTLGRKTTVFSSGVSMVSMVSSRGAGPFGSAILIARSKENLTSSEVSLLPLEKVRPSRRVQV